MHIAVIAANGRLGALFVEEALVAGHTVRAGIRGKSTFTLHPNLEIIECDATDPDDVRRLLSGQDVVVSALGHVKGSAPDVQTKATEIIITIMQEQGIKRFVDVTGTGVRFPGDTISLVDIFLNLAVKIVDPDRVKDGIDHMKVLQASTVEWTTIRILKLQNTIAQPFDLLLNGPTKWYVGRREVAKAMLQVIEKASFIQQAPILSRQKNKEIQ
jgi:putative NADH-flavin reductase